MLIFFIHYDNTTKRKCEPCSTITVGSGLPWQHSHICSHLGSRYVVIHKVTPKKSVHAFCCQRIVQIHCQKERNAFNM